MCLQSGETAPFYIQVNLMTILRNTSFMYLILFHEGILSQIGIVSDFSFVARKVVKVLRGLLGPKVD